MSKQLVALSIPDISTFAKSLRASLAALDREPTHAELLNIVARCAGHRNFQALRAAPTITTQPPAKSSRVAKAIRNFDAGRMQRWPAKTNHQDLCLWVIWSRIPPDQQMTEREVSEIIMNAHAFGDHALLRRSLVDMKMLGRTRDGKVYRRIEKQPGPDATALMEAVVSRLAASSPDLD
ncbi:MAG TPA: DUF2087 domain-containing protein [Devosia sp.]|uniref:DUF2087 domain-containing protein n=1 Tax=Devosia sp. TaxID=1871048 RepID=UPI002F920745